MSDARWSESDADAAVRIMRSAGLRDLMGSDGCLCGYVQIRGFAINRSCHKSESSLRVYATGEARPPRELAMVATEALRQMREEDDWSDILVRYCNYTDDHDGSGWIGGVFVPGPGRCVYCHKPRRFRDSYLCEPHASGPEEHLAGGRIADMYAYFGLNPHGLQRGSRSVSEGARDE